MGADLDENVGRSPGDEMAHHLGSLWFLVKVSTSFMNRRHSSSSHGKAMHCTATGSPRDPLTACRKRERERESQSIRARFLLTGPLPRLPHLLYPNISSPIYIRVEMSWISEFQASLALGETWKNCSDFICLQFFRVKM